MRKINGANTILLVMLLSAVTVSIAASNPSPANGAVDVPVDTVLSWTAGTGVFYYKVYFGTNPTPGASEYKGNQNETTYDPGFQLDYNTTYYWRIDALTDSGNVTGTVWSFTITTGPASNPSPANGTVDVPVDTVLNWTAPPGTDHHKVYFGTNPTPGPSEYIDDFTEPTYNPGLLNYYTTYYWRIDEVNTFGTVATGAVWSFTTLGGASSPSPANGAIGVPLDTVLIWTESPGAELHEVYFGTDPTPDSEEYQGVQSDTIYDPGIQLDRDTTYYWRIDEVYASGSVTGTVWSFTTVSGGTLNALWRMDDNEATATVANSNSSDHGTFVDPTNPNTSYHHNADCWEGSGSLNFDGVDDCIEVYGYGGILGQNSRTCTAWIKTSGTQAGSILSWGNPGISGQSWIFRIELSGELGAGASGGLIKTTATVNDGQWHHVAAVLIDDGSPNVDEIQLYIDGQLQDTTVLSSQAINTVASQDVVIGAYKSSGTPSMYFVGLLDDVRIYDYALSSDEIYLIQAWNPAPGDLKASVDSLLKWPSGGGALSYDVYLGTDPNAVTSAQHLLGDINGDGPADITDLSILAAQWLTNPGAINHSADIAFSGKVDIEDFAALASDWGQTPDSSFKANSTDTFYDPGTLTGDTTYYWRVDEVTGSGTETGTVYSFTTKPALPAQAYDPSPTNEAIGVWNERSLKWAVGSGATSHDVYFGTNPTPDAGDFKGNQTNTTYDPGMLAYDTTYYWRIDEVNALGTTTGTVWSFTVTPPRLTPEEFAILAWDLGIYQELETYETKYECGFNLAGFVGPTNLNTVAAAGLKTFVMHSDFIGTQDIPKSEKDAIAQYYANLVGDHPATFGYYLIDEPYDTLPIVAEWVDAFKIADPDKLAYVNLLPLYWSGFTTTSLYQSYVDDYVSIVQNKFISYDNYAYTTSYYWSNLNIISTAAKGANVPFWNIVLSTPHQSLPYPTPESLRFQLYTTLAYGARGISWFTYLTPPVRPDWEAPITLNGTKRDTWYMLQDVNLQMHRIGHVYITLDHNNTYHNSLPSDSDWSISGYNLLVGDFTQNGTGKSFVMVVNKSLYSTINYTVSESLPGDVYYVSPTDGQFYPLSGSLTLAPGEGRLLTVQ